MKVETIFNGKHIIVDYLDFGENDYPYRITTFNKNNHWHEEISITKEMYEELKYFFENI